VSLGVLLIALILSGCGHPPALDPAGPEAGHIARLWAIFFWLAVIVETFVVAVALYAVARVRRGSPAAPTLGAEPALERRLSGGVSVAVGVTTVTLVGLLVASVLTERALGALQAPNPVTIEVTGHQWWWEAEYWDPIPSQRVRTANEIHVPVGEAVLLKVHSTDVIHSLWIPPLHGKRDMIPGHDSSLWIQADRPGTFGGQCAEFCGYQHAHMRLLVMAESRAAFDGWLAQQRKSAPEPADDRTRHGRDVFLGGPCVVCHAIAGTPAAARLGPDLTHLAGRTTIAGGILPNTPGHLAGWILDAQGIKPGAHMPSIDLEGGDLQALLAYLGTLK
jgi:cytochrome c oxidase subunit 2